jgi:hypothetical protein
VPELLRLLLLACAAPGAASLTALRPFSSRPSASKSSAATSGGHSGKKLGRLFGLLFFRHFLDRLEVGSVNYYKPRIFRLWLPSALKGGNLRYDCLQRIPPVREALPNLVSFFLGKVLKSALWPFNLYRSFELGQLLFNRFD